MPRRRGRGRRRQCAGGGDWTIDAAAVAKEASTPRGLTNRRSRPRSQGGRQGHRQDGSQGSRRSATSLIIARYALENGVSIDLAHAVVTVESNYKPYSRGSAGEVGLMQIKPATAKLMGYKGSSTGLFDPETNIKLRHEVLGKAQRLGDGRTCGTILKYNAGHGAKRMNPVSRNYCAKVKGYLAKAEKAQAQLVADSGV